MPRHKHQAIFTLLLLVPCTMAVSQTGEDSVRMLEELAVEAYAAERNAAEIPASVQVLQSEAFERFSPVSLLPAFNMLPGIRMEERSPGSYRFSIRGSLLRSPFGVRNVKFYWNGLPFTDGGGNTYLNLFDLQAVGRAEIIKGPAASLYGAGTGGAVLLRTPALEGFSLGLAAQYGSFGSARFGADVTAIGSRVQFVRQQSDGYREQSSFERNAFVADLAFPISPSDLIQFAVLHSDLSYQTPGGLNEAQYFADPSQARPATPTGPGAVEQQTSVNNNTYFSGIHFEHQWSKTWRSAVGVAGSTTRFQNPAIRNYETRDEKNIAIRQTNEFEHVAEERTTAIVFGGEYQQYEAPILVRNNAGGTPGMQIISQDAVTSRQVMGFLQGEIKLKGGWRAVAAASLNYLELKDARTVPGPPATTLQSFNPEMMPRLALYKELSSSYSVYVSGSRGFSPPTVSEVLPSTGIYNSTLKPESGWSYEAGLNGRIGAALAFHLALYDFRLVNAIVLQRDSSGADYYVNAGDTKQQGMELHGTWTKNLNSVVNKIRITAAANYSNFHFGNYENDGADFSGNQITGVPPWTAVAGIDLQTQGGGYLQVTATFTDRIPLNDANTDFAADLLLLGTRVGLKLKGRLPLNIYAGVDNALNQRYSLGNDLNASAGRYYNAAPTINFYAGLTARVPFE